MGLDEGLAICEGFMRGISSTELLCASRASIPRILQDLFLSSKAGLLHALMSLTGPRRTGPERD